MLDKVGIAPMTLQDPATIESYIPFTMSTATLQWAARNEVIPILFTPIDALVRGCIDAFQGAAHEAGRNVEWGRGLGHFREILIADTDEEAIALMENGLGYVWPRWHHWFGFNEALRNPGEQGEIANTAATVRERGYSLCGSVDTVTRLLENMIRTLNTNLIVPWISVGPMPIDALLKSNDLLVEKVLPKLGIELERFQPTLRQEFTGELWRDASR
jgi:alkanesulfonate monooxygenase SsuD/methylene tetrahydromethanopterin reductase-like flavin-dependent oxidoreductase (luciferase family)